MNQSNENKNDLMHLQTIQLINEIKKPGREPLYNSNSRNYKNNLEKNRIWENIGKTLKTDTVELQKLWKHLKRKYINIIITNKIKENNMDLVNAMDYFKNFFFSKDDKYVYFNQSNEEILNFEQNNVALVDERRTQEFQLIEEIKKVGREALYDYCNTNHKNNFVKNKIWETIGLTLNISGGEAQKIWKNLKREYYNQIKNEINDVNSPKTLDTQDMELMKKMNYFRKFFIRNENTETDLDLDVSNTEDIFKDIKLDPIKIKEFQLIEEMKKPGREPLYDSTIFTHTETKNKIWENIAETLKLSTADVQKLWKNLKKKYYYRIERKKSGLGMVVPKKIKLQETMFMVKMSYFKEFFIASEENNLTMTIIKNDSIKNCKSNYEFWDTSTNSELDIRNPLMSESDGNEFENTNDNELEIVEDDKQLEEQEQFYAPKKKKQKFIESATKAIENINATHDAYIEKLMTSSINASSKKTVISTFVSYLEAVLETKTPKVQNQIISEINEILKSY